MKFQISLLMATMHLKRIDAFQHTALMSTSVLKRQSNANGWTTRVHLDTTPTLRISKSFRCMTLRASVDETDPTFEDEHRKGILVLLTVPMAWGTFEPAVRYVYDIQPDVPPFLFQFIYYLIAASSLSALALTPLANGDERESRKDLRINDDEKSESSSSDALSFRGGIELGTYLFLGNAFQVVGLKTVASDRAAFLLQLTTIFVPLVQSVLAKSVSAISVKTWLACSVALVGVACIGLDGTATTNEAATTMFSMDNLAFSPGDIYVILAAFFYTFHCIRLETYAKTTPAIKLAASKANTETFWCAVVIAASLLAAAFNTGNAATDTVPLVDMARSSGENILSYKDNFLLSLQNHDISLDQWYKLSAATVWTGLVTIAYTITAQSFGQSLVPPTTANLIYSIQPFFTAIVAFLVLGETLEPAGYAGGVLIGGAVLLVIQGGDDSENTAVE